MTKFKSDIQIAREAKMKPIQEILSGIYMPIKYFDGRYVCVKK